MWYVLKLHVVDEIVSGNGLALLEAGNLGRDMPSRVLRSPWLCGENCFDYYEIMHLKIYLYMCGMYAKETKK